MPASCPRARLRLRSAPHRTAAARSRRRGGVGGGVGEGAAAAPRGQPGPEPPRPLALAPLSLPRSLPGSLARSLARHPPPPPQSPLSALLGNAVRSSYSLYSRAAIGCHRMCLSKQNYFSSFPSPNPRRRPSRTSVEDLGNFARLPCTPRFAAWARREPRRRRGGGKFACMQIFFKNQTS